MKVSNVAQLTDNGEIVGRIDPLLLSILREVTATKTKGTWCTIRQELLPKDEPTEVRAQQQAPKLDPRNMEFGPSGGWATRAPVWVEDLRSKLADRKLFGTAMSRIGRPTTFGQLMELLRQHDWFTKTIDARPLTAMRLAF